MFRESKQKNAQGELQNLNFTSSHIGLTKDQLSLEEQQKLQELEQQLKKS